MKEVHMGNTELARLAIIQKVYNKILTQEKAAQELNLSVRQIKRLYKRFKTGLSKIANLLIEKLFLILFQKIFITFSKSSI